MVIDSVAELKGYCALSEGLASAHEKKEIPVCSRYSVDREHTLIFFPEEGDLIASTTWRENPESLDPIAAAAVKEGSFVLFLPGEPYLVKTEGRASMIKVR